MDKQSNSRLPSKAEEQTRVTIKTFEQLNKQELYDILALRTNVFVVEQDCAYPELDYADQHSDHLLRYDKSDLVAYARVAPPGSIYDQASIGRVVVAKSFRGKGLAKEIFQAAINRAAALYPKGPFKIQAQTYLESFYQQFGFEAVSAPYPDYGILHVDMMKTQG